MDVFCEAMNADHSVNPPQETRKCFLTSEIVDKLKNVDFDCSQLRSYVRKKCGFSMHAFDMVMMPVCEEGNQKHWWLIVADLRDHRFDVLNSLRMNVETIKISKQISDNFRQLYQSMFDKPNLKDFELYEQPSPKQFNNHDCGIYVMKYMEVWNGRKVYPMDGKHIYDYRRKIVNYILRHPKNQRTTDEIKEAIAFKYPDEVSFI